MRYFICVIAIFSTIMFISNIITSLCADGFSMAKKENGKLSLAEKYTIFRIITGIIMSFSWAYIII